MSTQFDFDRQLTAWLDADASGRAPDRVLSGALRRTVQIHPRRRMAFLERWLPMQLTMQRPILPRALVYLVAVLALALLLALSMFLVGGRPKLPGPFGLARPGQIAYDLNGDIYARALGAAAAVPITTGEPFDNGPVYSPDGQHIAFFSIPSSARQDSNLLASLMLIDADGNASSRRVLVADTGIHVLDALPVWSPDSKYLAFSSDNSPFQIAVYSVATGELVSRIGDATDLTWSPDGTKIAFTSVGDARAPGVWVADRDGQNLHEVSEALGTTFRSISVTDVYIDPTTIGKAAWSPDATQIAFTAGEFHPRLFVVGADGQNLREFSALSGGGDYPVWSPTGSRIAFVRSTNPNSSGEYNISVVNADGTAQVDFVSPFVFGTLEWAPDESMILAFADDGGLGGGATIALDPTSGEFDTFWPSGGRASWQRLAP